MQWKNTSEHLCETQSMKVSKLCDRNQGRPEGFLFNGYDNEEYGEALLISLDCSTFP